MENDTFDPQGLRQFCACPYCKVNVAHDTINHKIIFPDRLDCKVCKMIFKIKTKELTVTDDDIVNQIEMIKKVNNDVVQQLNLNTKNIMRIQNNWINLKKRVEALEASDMKKTEWIKGLSEDIIALTKEIKKLGGDSQIVSSSSEH